MPSCIITHELTYLGQSWTENRDRGWGVDSALAGYRGQEGKNDTLTCYYVHMTPYVMSPNQSEEVILALGAIYRVMQEMLEQPPSAEKAATGRQLIAISSVLEEICANQVALRLENG